mgnify:CR=1 FL=1
MRCRPGRRRRQLFARFHPHINDSIAATVFGVAYIDSAGLGELVNAYTTVKRQGGALKLVGVTKKLKDLLVITKLVNVFEAHDTAEAAVRSFDTLVAA